MLLHLVTYLVLVFAAVTAVWLAAHMIGVTRPFSGPTGLAWLDAEDAFNRVRKQHGHHLLVAKLHRSPHWLDLPDLGDVNRLLLIGQRNPREQLIALRDVVGTVDGAAGKFDRDFRPTDDRSRWRFKQIIVAIRKGDALPPSRSSRTEVTTTSPTAITGSPLSGRSRRRSSRRMLPRHPRLVPASSR